MKIININKPGFKAFFEGNRKAIIEFSEAEKTQNLLLKIANTPEYHQYKIYFFRDLKGLIIEAQNVYGFLHIYESIEDLYNNI